MFRQMDLRSFVLTLIGVMVCTIGVLLLGQCAEASSANVGVSYSQIIDDRSFGVTGDYETAISDRVKFEADGSLQAGDIHNVKVNTNLIFDISAVDLKLLIENKAKGYTLATLGREQSIGLAFTVPIENLGGVDVGIGGKNASPFGAPNAYDTLVGAGFAESAITGKGLESLSPAPKGLPFKNGNALNAFLTTSFAKGIFDIDVKGIFELVGDGDKQHQVIFNFKTSGKVYDIIIATAFEVGLMSYQDEIHYETGVITTAGFAF